MPSQAPDHTRINFSIVSVFKGILNKTESLKFNIYSISIVILNQNTDYNLYEFSWFWELVKWIELPNDFIRAVYDNLSVRPLKMITFFFK